jgi:type II secretory pathway pseudopilin PulG
LNIRRTRVPRALPSRQRGFGLLGVIMVVVVIIGAVMVAMSKGGGTDSSAGNRQAERAYRSALDDMAASIERGVTVLVGNGVRPEAAWMSADATQGVFGAGGQKPLKPDAKLFEMGKPATQWVLRGGTHADFNSTPFPQDGNVLYAFLPGVRPGVCKDDTDMVSYDTTVAQFQAKGIFDPNNQYQADDPFSFVGASLSNGGCIALSDGYVYVRFITKLGG